TYPFERQRFWINPSSAGEVGQMQTTPQAASSTQMGQIVRDIREAFYTPVWKQAPLPTARNVEQEVEANRYLVFTDACGLGDLLVESLKQQGHEVTTVAASDSFAKTGAEAYEINPHARGDYEELVSRLVADQRVPQTILHLWSVTDDEAEQTGSAYFADLQVLGYTSLLSLTQALGKQGVTDALTIWALSTQLHELGGWEAQVPEKATLLGASVVIPQEYPNIRCHALDLSLPRMGTHQADMLRDQLLAEFRTQATDRVIAYRGRGRWVQTVEPQAHVAAETEQSTHLRENGVYLIAGGFGKMGQMHAETLAKHVQAKLVLTTRHAMPARHEWESLQSASGVDVANDATLRRIEFVRKLEALGAEVLTVQADVTDRDHMQAAVQAAYDRFGALHGVIFAAGNADPDGFTAIAETGVAESETHFESRVHGLYVLSDVLQGRELDFTLLVSSLASVLGGVGFVAPCASHLFMDAFAHLKSRAGQTPWITVNFEQMTTEEVGIALQQALVHQSGVQLIVSKQDLNSRLDQLARLQATAMQATHATNGATSVHPRPNLHNPYVPPTNELEELLAEIMQDLLGIDQVGIHDNFFHLGGNSLLGTQVVTRIRTTLQVDVPLRVLFEANTVYDLGLIVEDIMLSELEELDEEEASQLL
ncbi:MAG: SDR family NAD(P)-dependent oxidoreductase, partial [Tumebacillaceae bacterium]